MTLIPGTNIGAQVVPYDSADSYPSHYALYGKGGLRTVQSITERNSIPVQRLEKGNLVHVIDNGNTYALKDSWAGGATVDTDWEIAYQSLASYGTPTIRYVDPFGSNTNNGLDPSTPWQTIDYAIQQCNIVNSGYYRIVCASGTYLNTQFSVPDSIGRNTDPSQQTLIEIYGDPLFPALHAIQNSGVICYQYSNKTIIKFTGVTLLGDYTNIGIIQRAGVILFENSIARYFSNFTVSSGLCTINSYNLLITGTYIGFICRNGVVCNLSGNNSVSPNDGASPCYLLYMTDSNVEFVSSSITTIVGNIVSKSGFLIYAKNSNINLGDNTTFNINQVNGLYNIDSLTYAKPGSSVNIYFDNNVDQACTLSNNSIYEGNASVTWHFAGATTYGVQLGVGAILQGPDIVYYASTPFGRLTELVQYIPDQSYIKYGYDNRYISNYCFTVLGNLPQGYSLVDLCPDGSLNVPYTFHYVAVNEQLIQLTVKTKTSNGIGVSDTYIIYKNNTTPLLSVTLTNTDTATITGEYNLSNGDRLSVKFSSDISTLAEDITVQIACRRTES